MESVRSQSNPFSVHDHVRIKNTPTVGKVNEVLSDKEVTVVFPTGACARIFVDSLERISPRILDHPSNVEVFSTRPNYYKCELKRSEGTIEVECLELIDGLQLNFNLGNALKYLFRAGKKSPSALEDLKKAKQYMEFEIGRMGTNT